jgi:hypothetical protein
MPAGPGPGSDGQVRQIARNERRAIEVLDVEEPQIAGAGVQLSGIEIAPERFPACRHPLGHLAMEVARDPLFDCVRRVGVVENDFRPAREPRELAQRRKQSLLGQIGRDAEPNDEGRLAGSKLAASSAAVMLPPSKS